MAVFTVIDGNSILNRAYYGMPRLTAPDGTNTGAIFGFLNTFFRVLDEDKPAGVCVCFDMHAPTFRHKAYEGYKAARKPMDPELAEQLPMLKELLGEMGVKMFGLEGYEADDLLGTISRIVCEDGNSCVLVTGDRDAYQLVGNGTVLKYVSTNRTIKYDALRIQIDFGIDPARFIDIKALMGDSSDNIPGVRGIGEKTAFELIGRFGSLDNVYANINSDEIRPAVRAKLEAGREAACQSRMLATIDRHVPLDFKPDELLWAGAKQAGKPGLYGLMKKLGFEKLIAKLDLYPPQPAEELRQACAFETGGELPSEGLCGLAFADDFSGFAVASVSCVKVFAGERLDEFLQSRAEISCYDAKRLHRYMRSRGKRCAHIAFDAMLAGYVLGIGQDFDKLCAKYAGGRVAAPESGQLTPDSANQPALLASQAGALLELAQNMAPELKKAGCDRLFYEIELPLAEVIADMELAGFKVDREGLVAFGKELDAAAASLERKIRELTGEPDLNIASPRQLGEVLFEKLALRHGKKTKTGYSTGADVLKHIANDHPCVPMILEWRNLSKLKSTYVDGLLKQIGEDGRIHCVLNQSGTVTGRISSSDPNLQNIPVRSYPGSRFRELFLAGDGHVLIDADYSQIELRVLASIAGDETMIKAFTDGADIHAQTAAAVLSKPISEVTPAERSSAKAVNFGIVYGISDYSLSDDIGVPVHEARALIDKYMQTYKGIAAYMKNIVDTASRDGFVSTLYGRRRYLPDINASNFRLRSAAQRVALNTPIQGSAADIIKLAMLRVYRRLEREHPKARLILQVHDELIIEAPESEAKAVLEIVKYEMEQAAELAVRLPADGGIGKTWAQSKN